MRALWMSVWLGLMSFSHGVFAAPPAPWLAVAEGSHSFSVAGCATAAAGALQEQGFVRVSNMGSTVMGAYRGGSNYEYKAAVKCQSGSAVAFVVTTLSGRGLSKANSIIAALSGGGVGGAGDMGGDDIMAEELPPAPEGDYVDEYEDEYYE